MTWMLPISALTLLALGTVAPAGAQESKAKAKPRQERVEAEPRVPRPRRVKDRGAKVRREPVEHRRRKLLCRSKASERDDDAPLCRQPDPERPPR